MPLTEIEVDETPHNMDGLVLHGWDGSERVEAFISRRVMESWVDPREPYRKRRSLLRAQYNALGKLNLAAIVRIAASKYQRGVAFQPPASVCGYSAIRHHRKQRGARYERTSARTAASLIPSDSTLES